MHVTTPPSTLGGRMATSDNASSTMQSSQRPKRVDTQDLKSKLASALGTSGKRYWSALLQFMTAKIDRNEFEEEAVMCLKPQHVHLHNSLVLGLLFNASADVPGPSYRSGLGMYHDRDAKGQLVDKDGNVLIRFADADDADGDAIMLQPPKKRMRLLAAGLSRKERARIRNIPKHLLQRQSATDGGASSLGWAGVGADMLEKKRKEEDKRRSAEEKQRTREAYSEIGARDWKLAAIQGQGQVASVHERLSTSVQQEIARAMSTPLCVDSKQLPDLETMRDLLTLHAVEAGLPQGAQPQAAAMLLAALHSHLQNVTSTIITKIRANREMGIRVTGIEHDGEDRLRLLTDANSIEDESFGSSFADDSPLSQRRSLHPMLHDSSSVSSGSASLGVLSAADSSMVSLVSTAPTSVVHGSTASSDNASNADAGASAVGSNGSGVKANKAADGDQGDVSISTDSYAGDMANLDRNSIKDGTSRMELRHLSFLLDTTPHAVVEPLGQGSHERLLAADWTSADEQAQRQFEASSEGVVQRQARMSANAKMSGVAQQASAQGANNSARNNFIIDQLAPIRVFDRRTLTETQANTNGKAWTSANAAAHPKKGGLSLPAAQYKQKTALHAVPSSSENSSADDPPQRNALTSDDTEEAAETTSGEERYAADLAAIIASRYGTHAALPVNGASHHRSSQDAHLYEVVDPAALLSTIAA